MRYNGGADLHRLFGDAMGRPWVYFRAIEPVRPQVFAAVGASVAVPPTLGWPAWAAWLSGLPCLPALGATQRSGDPNQAGLAVCRVVGEWLTSIGELATDRSVVRQINSAIHAQEG